MFRLAEKKLELKKINGLHIIKIKRVNLCSLIITVYKRHLYFLNLRYI